MPIKSVLSTGPAGLCSVLTAIAAAARKPITVPSAVALVAPGGNPLETASQPGCSTTANQSAANSADEEGTMTDRRTQGRAD
jgi:hypothetical protein